MVQHKLNMELTMAATTPSSVSISVLLRHFLPTGSFVVIDWAARPRRIIYCPVLLTRFQVCTAIVALHYAYPALTFFYFLFALTITVCMLQTQSLRVQDAEVRRDVMLGLIFAVAGTYVRLILPDTMELRKIALLT
jgi:hypothetical protein